MNTNIKTALIAGGIALGLLVLFSLLWGGFSGGPGGGRGGMMGPGMMGGWGGWGLGGIFMILFWILIIWGVVALVRGLSGSSGGEVSRQDSPLDILKRRYARGELSKEEYEERKRELS